MSDLSQFYRDKTVFITGVTGFIGKVFLEKLLRKFCDLKMVYLLIREKGGENASQRFENLLSHQVFNIKFI